MHASHPSKTCNHPKRIVLLGSTGSIGQSTLQVVRNSPQRFKLVGLAAGRQLEKLVSQANEFDVSHLVTGEETQAQTLASLSPSGAHTGAGQDALCELASMESADIVLIAIVGTAGLAPALAAIDAGKDIAVASKEILVMAGGLVMEAARKKGVAVLPVDSEHNAIFQCLQGLEHHQISKLILTASGGPFRTWAAQDLAKVTPEQALKHPTWEMGAKISIDSATLFNKGLEMIEARWLFNIPMSQIDVLVHPQSIVHSMVETVDGSLLAQLSENDMCFPIQYALSYPERVAGALPNLNLAQIGKLEFEKPRWDDFPALHLAKKAGEIGGTLPAVYNAANEVAVDAFRAKRLHFPAIWQTVENTMAAHKPSAGESLEEIQAADHWARTYATELVN